MSLTTDRDARKAAPVYEGFMCYFPNAVVEVAALSKAANDFHNPGEPVHWSFHKSNDHGDCIGRHQMDAGTIDTDGVRHATKVAWRAMAQLETELIKAGATPGKNVRYDEAKLAELRGQADAEPVAKFGAEATLTTADGQVFKLTGLTAVDDGLAFIGDPLARRAAFDLPISMSGTIDLTVDEAACDVFRAWMDALALPLVRESPEEAAARIRGELAELVTDREYSRRLGQEVQHYFDNLRGPLECVAWELTRKGLSVSLDVRKPSTSAHPFGGFDLCPRFVVDDSTLIRN